MLSANFKPKRTAAASRSFLVTARLSYFDWRCIVAVNQTADSKNQEHICINTLRNLEAGRENFNKYMYMFCGLKWYTKVNTGKISSRLWW